MPKSDANIDLHDKKKDHLPPDLIFEILIRTAIESLRILRWVCKEWCNLLTQPHFINHHHQRAKNVRGFIFHPRPVGSPAEAISFVPHPTTSPSSEALPALNFLPERVKIEASTTHGILCCVGLHQRRNYYVCKPTTKEWTQIPSPRAGYKTHKVHMVVAFKDNNNGNGTVERFKIVRISNNIIGKSGLFHWEMFDSDTWKWTELNHIQSLLGTRKLRSHNARIGFVVKGCFCWLTYENKNTQIMTFDIWKEELGTLQIPQETLTDIPLTDVTDVGMWLTYIDGKLGLITYPPYSLEYNVWVMPCMVEQRWEMKGSFNEKEEDFGWWGVDTASRIVVDDVLFLFPSTPSPTYLLWGNLNLNDKSCMHVRVDDRAYFPDTVFFFQSDFFPCNIFGKRLNMVVIEQAKTIVS